MKDSHVVNTYAYFFSYAKRCETKIGNEKQNQKSALQLDVP